MEDYIWISLIDIAGNLTIYSYNIQPLIKNTNITNGSLFSPALHHKKEMKLKKEIQNKNVFNASFYNIFLDKNRNSYDLLEMGIPNTFCKFFLTERDPN